MSTSRAKTDPARLLAARVLTEVMFEGAIVGDAADRHLNASELLPKSRSFASFLIFGGLTYWIPLARQLNAISHERLDTMSKYLQSVLILGVFQLVHADSVPSYAAVNTSVELAAYFVGDKVRPLTNALLRKVATNDVPLPRRSPGLAFGWPNELFGLLRASYGEAMALRIAADSTRVRPETSIRLNRTRLGDDILAASLDPEIEVRPGRLTEYARRLLLKGRSPLLQDAYTKGLFSLQNESSQLAVTAMLAMKPASVLELCSGNGGKTAALLEGMASYGGKVTSVEIDRVKIERSKTNLARLGLPTSLHIEADATQDLVDLVGGPFDLVVCDVPCSGLGVVAKKPEIRHRMSYERINSLIPLQAAILSEACKHVRHGSHLYYLTCTHNKMENEAQVERFLTEHEDFQSFDMKSVVPADLHGDIENGYLNLFGHQHDVDGFFMAALLRKKR